MSQPSATQHNGMQYGYLGTDGVSRMVESTLPVPRYLEAICGEPMSPKIHLSDNTYSYEVERRQLLQTPPTQLWRAIAFNRFRLLLRDQPKNVSR